MTKTLLSTISLLLLFQLTAISQKKEIVINNDIQLLQLTESVYAHITWINSEKWGRFSNNGAVYIKNGKALLVDTPMDSMQTVQLVEFLRDSMSVKVTHFIPGHYHADCLEGMPYLHSLGVKSIAGSLTIEKCKELNVEVPKVGFTDSLNVDFENAGIVCYYMGGGHTQDNIVVSFKNENVLFGGCFVKSNTSGSLGNLKDAVVDQWLKSMQRAKEKFGGVDIVIPGHGSIDGAEQFDHTLDLLNKLLQSK